MKPELDQCLATMPVAAILRGVKPAEVVEIGKAIQAAGISVIEVPLNSPQPFESIAALSESLGDRCVIGCGTLVDINDVLRLAQCGAKIAVMPNTNVPIIQACIEHGIVPMPGWATPSEAFTAYQAGARYLKLFPAASYGPAHIKAVKAVIPADAKILAVGGVGPAVAMEWLAAGVDGFGIGGEIYKPGYSAAQVGENVTAVVSAISRAQGS